MVESQLRMQPDGSMQYVDGYFLTFEQLELLISDYQADQIDGFVSNVSTWLEYWVEKNTRRQLDKE